MTKEELEKEIEELFELITPESIAALSDEDLRKLKGILDKISK